MPLWIGGFIVGWVVAYRHYKAGALDVARSLGLADAPWKKVRMRSPQAFDAWKASLTAPPRGSWPWSTGIPPGGADRGGGETGG